MLKRLQISNYALINRLEASFPGALTVITGETGAGKSIFLEAFGLVLGQRADTGVLQNKDKKCVVEARFNITALHLQWFFKEHDLDYEEELLLRREINPEGKSRCFVNDTPVNLTVLKELSVWLVDVHSQHQNLLVQQNGFQLGLVDCFANTAKELDEYKSGYPELKKLRAKLKQLHEQEEAAKKEKDYYSFLLEELQGFDLDDAALKKLEEESAAMENAELIKTALSKSSNILQAGDESILQNLANVKKEIQSIGKFKTSYANLLERFNAIIVEIKDLSNELDNENETLQYNPAELQELNSRLDKTNRLLNKHSVKSASALLQLKQEIETKLHGFENIEELLRTTQNELLRTENKCMELAEKMRAKRIKAIPEIEKNIEKSLSLLAMPNARFQIMLDKDAVLNAGGIDKITLLFSANKGGEFKELHKVASGGEISRLMLSLKAAMATKQKLPTIIFDEIDTGISGDVADKMGKIFNAMARSMQVISITHLPQIASKGKHHLFVYKNEDGDKTLSYIKEISGEERVVEIAKMLSTGKPGEAAIKNAEDLLKMN